MAEELNLDPNPLVTDLEKRLGAPDSGAMRVQIGEAGSLATAAGVPEVVSFTGYLGGKVPHGKDGDGKDVQWCLLYLDADLRTWLIIEAKGIVRRKTVEEKTTDADPCDVVWVLADAAVGRGSGSLSLEGQFLTGEFTRAADVDEGPMGAGTFAAATGMFCAGRSVNCCTPKSPRPRPR